MPCSRSWRPTSTKSGQADLTWAFAEAAVLFLRHNPAGQKSLTRWERQHGQGKALTILAPQVARAVDAMRKRDPAVDGDNFLLSEEWRRPARRLTGRRGDQPGNHVQAALSRGVVARLSA
jgi:hypothetical protein